MTTRRQFLGTAAAVPMVGSAAAQDDDGDDDDDEPIQPVLPGQRLAAAAANATDYLFDAVEDVLPFTGPDVNGQSYQDLEAQQRHLRIYQDAKEMNAYDEQVLTNINNLLDFAPNALYADAKLAALRVNEEGGSLDEAKSAAEEAVKSRVVKTQKNILKHFKLQLNKIIIFRNSVQDTAELDLSTVFTNNIPNEKQGGWKITGIEKKEYKANFVDGSSQFYDGLKVTSEKVDAEPINDSFIKLFDNGNHIEVKDPESDSKVTLLGPEYAVWTKIENTSETIISEVKTLLDNVYEQLDSDQYDASDLISGTDLADQSSDPQSFAAASADLAALNIPLSDSRLIIELPEANNGEGQTYEGSLAVISQENVELDVGKRYDPQDLPGQVVLSYNYRDQTDELRGAKTILNQPFEIIEATADDGQSRSTVTFSGRNQQTTDTNVDALVEELRQIREQQREIEDQQEEIATSGGIQLPDLDELDDSVVSAAIVFVGLWLISRGNSS